MTFVMIVWKLLYCNNEITVYLSKRYEEIKTKLTPFLKKSGFNPKTGLFDVLSFMYM